MMLRDIGYIGLLILYRFYLLYGFFYDKSSVYDEMYIILLNFVKNVFLDLINDDINGIDWLIVDSGFDNILWLSGKFFLLNLNNYCCFLE